MGKRSAQFFRRWEWMLWHRRDRAERAEPAPTVDRLAETQKMPGHQGQPDPRFAELTTGTTGEPADDYYVFCNAPRCLEYSTILTAGGWEFREFWIALPTPPGCESAGLIKRESRCPIHRSGTN